ncbi:MAG: ABC transporter permease [Fidelibacterota bacterium]
MIKILSGLLPIIKKEFIHIRRDPRSLGLIFALPILMILLYGYAINLDVKNIPLAVYDKDRTRESERLIEKFTNTGYFQLKARIENHHQIEKFFKRMLAKSVLIIPEGYAKSIETDRNTKVQFLIDGSNANVGIIALNYARMITMDASLELIPFKIDLPFDLRTRILYNPDLKSTNFIVPGLIAVLLMMICALLTSVTIAREKEMGTMEQILVSPIKPGELIIGKVMPYVIIAFLDGVIILAFAKLWFKVPIRGSLMLVLALSVVYLFSALSIGLLISTIARTQQVAMIMALVSSIMPSIILSGLIFPIPSMPKFLQLITYTVPARYFLQIIRGILLKGIGINYLWKEVGFLFALGLILTVISTIKFKTELE